MTGNIIITGSKGWLSREFLEYQFQEMKEINPNIFKLLGRGQSKLILSNGQEIIQEDFMTTSPKGEVEGIVHLAFLTMGKLDTMQKKFYQEENSAITLRIKRLIQETNPKWLIIVSSGAAAVAKHGFSNNAIDVYGSCKIDEENTLRELCSKTNTIFVCGRLWGALGKFMPVNRSYAASDFIYSALTKNQIIVNNSDLIYRSFVDAGEFMNLLFTVAKSGTTLELNSGGHSIELGDLAKKIGLFLNINTILRPQISKSIDKSYLPPDNSYEEFAANLGLSLTDIDSMIKLTINGHKSQLGIQ